MRPFKSGLENSSVLCNYNIVSSFVYTYSLRPLGLFGCSQSWTSVRMDNISQPTTVAKKNTCIESYDRVNIIQCLVGTIALIDFFFSVTIWISQKGGVNKMFFAVRWRKGKVFGKGEVCFLLGVNENLATEKNPLFFHTTWKCHWVLLLQHSWVSSAAAPLEGVSSLTSSSFSSRAARDTGLCAFVAQSM